MTRSIDAIAQEIQSLEDDLATLRLAGLPYPLGTEVLRAVPESIRRSVIRAATQMLGRGGYSLTVREGIVWLLRDSAVLDMVEPEISRVLAEVYANVREPDELRCLALDSLENLWLGGALTDSAFHKLADALPAGAATRTRQRWIRVVGEIDAQWAVRRLSEVYRAESDVDALRALSESPAQAAQDALVALRQAAATEEDRRRVSAALERCLVSSAKRRISCGTGELSAGELEALVSHNEFAAIYKAAERGWISTNSLDVLRDGPVPEGLSKSQRRFLRKLNEMK